MLYCIQLFEEPKTHNRTHIHRFSRMRTVNSVQRHCAFATMLSAFYHFSGLFGFGSMSERCNQCTECAMHIQKRVNECVWERERDRKVYIGEWRRRSVNRNEQKRIERIPWMCTSATALISMGLICVLSAKCIELFRTQTGPNRYIILSSPL